MGAIALVWVWIVYDMWLVGMVYVCCGGLLCICGWETCGVVYVFEDVLWFMNWFRSLYGCLDQNSIDDSFSSRSKDSKSQ